MRAVETISARMTLAPENVQDYPRPPALERVPQRLSIWFAGQEIAATAEGWRVLETHHAPTYYLPPEAFLAGILKPARGQSFCEWKGIAAYWDIVVGDQTAQRAAWSYPSPTATFLPIKDHLAVYAHAVDSAWVGDVQVTPQPGNFYGGWVTPNLQGTVKGAPGTRHW